MEPLPTLLERTAGILADSARLLLEIEDSIAPLLTPTLHRNANPEAQTSHRARVVSLQKIDLLSQTLEDLSFWLEDLASEARRNTSGALSAESATSRLRLADLRLRLHGQNIPPLGETCSGPILF